MQVKNIISVVVTTYNHELYIEKTINSVLKQKFNNYEIVVVDDGSIDGTGNILRKYKDKIKLITQKNSGVASSRNTGVEHARGELIAFLDGDDIWHEDKLKLQVEGFNKHPETGLVAVDGVQYADDLNSFGSLIKLRNFNKFNKEDIIYENFFKELLRQQFIVTVSQVMIPAAVLKDIGKSDVALKVASDYDLYLRISKKHRFTIVNKKLVFWRYHENSTSGKFKYRSIVYGREDIKILKKHLSLCNPKYQQQIKMLLNMRLMNISEETYYLAKYKKSFFAKKILINLLIENRKLKVLIFVAALFLPEFIIKYFGNKVRSRL